MGKYRVMKVYGLMRLVNWTGEQHERFMNLVNKTENRNICQLSIICQCCLVAVSLNVSIAVLPIKQSAGSGVWEKS